MKLPGWLRAWLIARQTRHRDKVWAESHGRLAALSGLLAKAQKEKKGDTRVVRLTKFQRPCDRRAGRVA